MRHKLTYERLHGALREFAVPCKNSLLPECGKHRHQKPQGRAGLGAVTFHLSLHLVGYAVNDYPVFAEFYPGSDSRQNSCGGAYVLRECAAVDNSPAFGKRAGKDEAVQVGFGDGAPTSPQSEP